MLMSLSIYKYIYLEYSISALYMCVYIGQRINSCRCSNSIHTFLYLFEDDIFIVYLMVVAGSIVTKIFFLSFSNIFSFLEQQILHDVVYKKIDHINSKFNNTNQGWAELLSNYLISN